MKSIIFNSLIVACKNKALLKDTTSYNREKVEKEKNADINTNDTDRRTTNKTFNSNALNGYVDFSGGLLGI